MALIMKSDSVGLDFGPEGKWLPAETAEGRRTRRTMNERDHLSAKVPEIVIIERRNPHRAELSSAEVMKILRKRAARQACRPA